ncbi:hypothetical protein LCGC14_1598620 [marine sediment metagenome]|uniref:Uncharacterized protein n=1 Tax=marine sediment metagenome TaxID=412755 RepID=A0A0F9KSJ9_9ZZZZ
MATEQEQNVLELSTGVKLQLHHPSSMLVKEATQALMKEEPRAPKVFIQEKEREEENPNDPTFIAEHNLWLAEVGIRALRALIPTGTSLLSKPDDVVGPEDEDFTDLMESMGQQPGTGKYSRYVQWVISVACGAADLEILSVRLMRLAGVPEEDVSSVLEGFPGIQERVSNPGGAPERSDLDRDPVPRARAEASISG